MKKQIYILNQLLERNNISLLDCTKKREGGSNSDDKERVHALVSSTSRSSTFIIDSGASIHMVSTRKTFSSLNDSKCPKIVLGDDFVTESMGKGRIDIDHGSFNDVLYVPGLSANLFSVYQMTHTGYPKKVIFSSNEVEISDMANGRVIDKGFVDHSSRVYRFSHFMPLSNPSTLLTHANEENQILHERFVHLN